MSPTTPNNPDADRPGATSATDGTAKPSASVEQSRSVEPRKTTEPATAPPRRRVPSLRLVGAILLTAVVALWVGINWGEPMRHGLEEIWRAGGGHDHAKHAEQAKGRQYYTCGMHPWVLLPKPGDCPICHMKLTPLEPSKFTGDLTINPVVTQNIGVRIEPVTSGPLERSIRTVGTVDYDETGVRDVNTKVNGWIEKLYVDYLGVQVEKGQPLFDFYSPDLYAAQEEYLLAWTNRDRIGADFVPDAAQGALDLLEAARTRLEYYDIAPQQIQALQASGKPAKAITILSPHRGVVIAKHANEGMNVDLGMQLYRIADLTKVWVMVTLYEYQLPFVTLGQDASMSLPYIPGQSFEGKVLYIYPYLEKKTRQVKVRLEFDNPTSLLKPGMYANVTLRNRLAEQRTLAPRAAVIDTGERQVAFVSLGGGKFEPRPVRMGIEMDNGLVQIIDGLKPGEMVVTSGQFLLDSEAKIRESLAKMIRGDLASEQQAVAATLSTTELASLSPIAQEKLRQMLESTFKIGRTLAGDSIEGIADPARRLAQGVDGLMAVEIPEHPHFWHKHEEAATVHGKALELADGGTLDEARLRFADMSVAFSKLLRATGVPPSYERTVLELHCPMYREGQGASTWLQAEGDVENPFFGRSMLGCFDSREALPVTGSALQRQ
jgi:Cu(I)/Ag(I) efflux system membrane fusion protein